MLYWNGNGKYQADYNHYAAMMPATGASGYLEIEAIRAVSRIYHDLYNNGFGNNWSGAFNYLETLAIPGMDENLSVIEEYKFGEYYGSVGENDMVAQAVENMVNVIVLWTKSQENINGTLTVSGIDMLTMTESEPIDWNKLYSEDEDEED